MQIASWSEDFQTHFQTPNHAPPVLVYETAGLLVGDQPINGSLTSYSPGASPNDPAVWSCWLAMDKAIAHFEIAFQGQYYDQYEEEADFRRSGTVRACWIRSLADVVQYELADLGPVVTADRWPRWCPVGRVILTFSGGDTLELPTQTGLHGQHDRQRSDEFHTAIRDACPI
jgi:hypothetical protein